MTDRASVVAVFGGSFNPPHLAHVLAVAAVLATHDVARLLVVPTYQHPFAKLGAKSLAPYEDRVRMAELAMGWLPKVTISRVEEELGGESRTLWTLEHIHAQHPSWALRFVIGADILHEAHKWYRFDAICALAPLIVLGRCGFEGESAPEPLLPDVSSTDVRAQIAAGNAEKLTALVPRAVLAYVRENGLYT